jgi:hypothetical protein
MRTTSADQFASRFSTIAEHFLNASELAVNGKPYRIAEVEAYYCGPGHADPFAHRNTLQREFGRWYFHRTGGQFRGGSFKGLDLTLGDGIAHFGILIRGMVDPEGRYIDGPSLSVDRLVAETQCRTVAALYAAIGGRAVWDSSSPLTVRPSNQKRNSILYSSARVGLSLRRATIQSEAARFVGQPYRFLSEPRATSKGKRQLALHLHGSGWSVDAIRRTTGCTQKAIARYIACFEEGRRAASFEEYFGRQLTTDESCQLLGTWAALYGGRCETRACDGVL